MATLIQFHNSDGLIGRCDARCYNATNPKCTCICGGKNHAQGFTHARDNTARYAALWLDRWEADHPDEPRPTVAIRRLRPAPPRTLPLWADPPDAQPPQTAPPIPADPAPTQQPAPPPAPSGPPHPPNPAENV